MHGIGVREIKMSVEHLDKASFDSAVEKGVTIVDFWAEWCGPCRMLGPVFEELSGEMGEIKFAKVNISENEELAQKFGVMSIPTLILFKDGKEVDRMMGAIPKENLKAWLGGKL